MAMRISLNVLAVTRSDGTRVLSKALPISISKMIHMAKRLKAKPHYAIKVYPKA